MLDAAWRGQVGGMIGQRYGGGNSIITSGVTTVASGLMRGEDPEDILHDSLLQMALTAHRNPADISGMAGAAAALPGAVGEDLYSWTAKPFVQGVVGTFFETQQQLIRTDIDSSGIHTSVKVSMSDIAGRSNIKLSVNGQSNTVDKAVLNGISQLGMYPGESFYTLYNPNRGGVADTIESMFGKYIYNDVSKDVNKVLEYASKHNIQVAMAVHSQGGITVNNALKLAAEHGVTLNNLELSYYGAAVNKAQSIKALSSVNARLGEFKINNNDFVPIVLGRNYGSVKQTFGAITHSPSVMSGWFGKSTHSYYEKTGWRGYRAYNHPNKP
jgi:hypothetical protein